MQRQVVFERALFSSDSLKRAAYRFVEQFSVDFVTEGERYVCNLTFKPNKSEDGASLLVSEFRNEVLDQDLREAIKKETEPVRNLILAHAFSKTSLVNNG